MRKVLLIITCLMATLFISCKKVDAYTKFNLEFNQSVTIPSSTGLNLPFNILTPDVKTNSEAEFEINDTRKDLIELIQITKLTMTHQSPSNGNFKFLKSIQIYLTAEGLSEIKVAWNENVSEDIDKTLELETTENDLQEYIKKDKFGLRVQTVTDEAFNSDQEIAIQSVFFVDAKILGQ
ncbi:hypothetical protein DNU06_00120 [Putridiphycobacter roseus]|uniref:Lipoprotein n=1 Tax=Putridiphycobacter roseus TaxID=2219161 RepID=A0A2W1NJY8_9FLAO|nr:hypothetical protein [Putridiphycobacter roseus]PZE18276.1 hypothetical protein DNU06_00120 [Putridiphycobacter roseus]